MLPLERHRLIVELLGQHGVMRVNEIAQATRVQGNDSPRSERAGTQRDLNPATVERWRRKIRCRRPGRRHPPFQLKIARKLSAQNAAAQRRQNARGP